MFGLTYILCFRRLVSIWQVSPGSPPIKVCMYVCMSKHTDVATMGMYVCLGVCLGKHTYLENYRYVCMSGETYIPRNSRYVCMSKVCISGETYIPGK